MVVDKSLTKGRDTMPTIKEIARECGVSVATVSNIINDKGKVGEETKKRVLQVIQEMNYTPNIVAQNLKTKNTRSIGVIAEDMTVFALPDIIDGITEYCEKEDYQILLVNLRLYKNTEMPIIRTIFTGTSCRRRSRSYCRSRWRGSSMWRLMRD